MTTPTPRILTEKDADLGFLQNRTIAILGYGSQGRAQALCLKDSGLNVIIGLPRPSKSRGFAKKDGFEVFNVKEAVRKSDIISFLFPDHLHQEVFESLILPLLKPRQVLVFAAAFSMHFGLVRPPAFVDVILVAPHAPGTVLRKLFVKGQGVPAFLSIDQDFSGMAKPVGLAYAKAIGSTRAFVMQTTFELEALGDLFGEQVVLCGGLSELVLAGFDTLVRKGLPPENAFLETLLQLDLIVNLLKEKGIAGMYEEISLLAAYGSYKNRKRIIGSQTRIQMEKIFAQIKSGRFSKELMQDYHSGLKGFQKFLAGNRNLLIDRTSAKLKRLLSK